MREKRKWKSIGVLCGLICICLLVSLCVYLISIRSISTKYIEKQKQSARNNVSLIINEGDIVRQPFTTEGKSCGLRISFATYNKKYDEGNICLYIEDDKGSILSQKKVKLSEIEDNAEFDWFFDDEVVFEAGTTYSIVIEMQNDIAPNTQISLYYDEKGEVSGNLDLQKFSINEIQQNGYMYFGLLTFSDGVTTVFIAVTILFVLAIFGIFVFLKLGKNLPVAFFVLCILLGLAYWLVVPALGHFDEHVHLQNVLYHTSRLTERIFTENAEFYLKEGYDYKKTFSGWAASVEKYNQIETLFETVDNQNVICYEMDTKVLQPSYMYLPQVAGAWIGYLLNFNLYTVSFIATMFNVLFYALIVAAAIKIMPMAKEVLMLIALNPSSIKAAASLSYDCFINSLSFLVIALILKIKFEEKAISRRDLFILIVAFALLAPCKMIYAGIGLMFLMIPVDKFGNVKRYVRTIVAALTAAGAMFIVTQAVNIFNLVQKNSNVVESPFGSEAYSYFDIFKDPLSIGKLFVITLTRDLGSIMSKAIARIQYIEYPIHLTIALVLCCVVMLIFTQNRTKYCFSGRDKIILALVVCLESVMIFVSAISWTEKTSISLMGVQGRYFIPILPVIFLCFWKNTLAIRSTDKIIIRIIYVHLFVQMIGLWVAFDKFIANIQDALVAW